MFVLFSTQYFNFFAQLKVRFDETFRIFLIAGDCVFFWTPWGLSSMQNMGFGCHLHFPLALSRVAFYLSRDNLWPSPVCGGRWSVDQSAKCFGSERWLQYSSTLPTLRHSAHVAQLCGWVWFPSPTVVNVRLFVKLKTIKQTKNDKQKWNNFFWTCVLVWLGHFQNATLFFITMSHLIFFRGNSLLLIWSISPVNPPVCASHIDGGCWVTHLPAHNCGDGSPRSPSSPSASKKDPDSPTPSDASFASSLGSSSPSLTTDEYTQNRTALLRTLSFFWQPQSMTLDRVFYYLK